MPRPVTMAEVFAAVPDHRDPSGRRYPLPGMLTFITVAMLSGARSVLAIAQFGRDRGDQFAREMGFARGTTPCNTTLHYFLKGLDAEAFERALRDYLRAQGEWESMSLDGKTLRGSKEGAVPGLHLLTAYAHEVGVQLEQVVVGSQENEFSAALGLVARLPVRGKTVLGDAIFCQRRLSQQVVKRGGDYLWPVKDNQPELRESVALMFEEPDFSPLRTRRCGS